MYEFDEDTRITKVGEGRFRGVLTDRWNIGKIPNGGYLMSVATRALAAELSHPDILTVSAHYAKPALPGAVELFTHVMNEGKSVSTGMVRLVQEGTERVCFAATAGHLGAGKENYQAEESPRPPKIEECMERIVVPGVTPEIMNRIDYRMAPRTSGWYKGRLTDEMVMGGYARFADGRPPDMFSLLLYADSFPPTVFTKYGLTGWIPTLQLNVQIRRPPDPGWLWCWIKTRHMTHGLFEEDGEFWDSSGKLVAISRQLARFIS